MLLDKCQKTRQWRKEHRNGLKVVIAVRVVVLRRWLGGFLRLLSFVRVADVEIGIGIVVVG